MLDQIQKKNLISGRFINQLDVDDSKKVAVISDDVSSSSSIMTKKLLENL